MKPTGWCDRFYELAGAPVDPREPLAFGEMQEYLVSRQLMRQKIPEQLEIVASLPRNEGLQKVVKFELRRVLLNRASCLQVDEHACPR